MANKSHIVLKKAYERIKKNNPSFSYRSLALKLNVSHVFVMKILKGQANVPDEMIPKLIKFLSLDDFAISSLKDAIIEDTLKEKMKYFPKNKKIEKKDSSYEYEEFPLKDFSLLESWYDLAILDFLTCELSDKSAKTIAMRLNLKLVDVNKSLLKMKEIGLVVEENGQWAKLVKRIRFPATSQHDVLKKYYKNILDHAKNALEKTSDEDYKRRSITNLSIAVNPKKVQLAKEQLQKAIYEIAEELSDGECEEVYFLTTCLFPVS